MFLSLTALSLFFLLKDGRTIRAWTERHMRVPDRVAHQMTGRVLQSLRGYFVGVTIVAAFNAVVVTIGALLLGVPKVGAIAIVTFLGAYVPYLGAWGAGAFAVLVALGGAGTDAAIGMAIVQLLANGVLQQMVQPIAYGAALGIHPLAVLIVTIAGGALFGAVGLILAAPLTAAATRIAADLARNAAPRTPRRAPGRRRRRRTDWRRTRAHEQPAREGRGRARDRLRRARARAGARRAGVPARPARAWPA